VRIGGQIQAPAQLVRVEPEYPWQAVAAGVQGSVILEAIVNEEGAVESVRVLRSIPLLDRSATKAVEQWRYSPLLLNQRPTRFVLTVVLTFNLENRR
jgi:TonB family protein